MHLTKVIMEHVSDMDILRLIPQRAPMVMVSGITEAADHYFDTWFLIEGGNIFLKNGIFQESGLIENIAQSAAAMNGYRALREGGPVRKGYIGSINNLEIHALPHAGDRLATRVRETHHVMDTSIIHGEVRMDDQLLAQCEMKVFIQAQ